MEISELVDEILERVGGDPVSSDPHIDHRILHSDLHNLIEKYDDEKGEGDSVWAISNLEDRNKELENELEEADGNTIDLEDEIETLRNRILELEAEDD